MGRDRPPVHAPIPTGGAAAAPQAPQDALQRIRTAAEELRDEPRPKGAAKLAGTQDLWRIRVGDYRVVYTITDDVLV
jgi:mRNA-degrading endonuclease RelE of RelBE toxin-antitoxin system